VANVLDRFYVKLLHISSTVNTAIGQAEAHRRAKFMRKYLRQLGREIRADHKPEEDS
jgi:HD superfamily phosphodiesterase